MKSGKRRPKVFLSYSMEDKRFADALRNALQEISGLVVVDPTDEWSTGAEFGDIISKMVRNSDIVVALLSSGSPQNPNVLLELGMAVGLGKKIIAIVRQDTDFSSIPFDLRRLRYITSTGPVSTARRLAKEFQ